MVYAPKSDGVWLNKSDLGGTATSNLIDAGDANRWEANQLDADTRLGVLESGGSAGALFNVRNYGALGNGSADDTAAFQAAINAALLKPGSTLYIPPPNLDSFYKITDTLKLYDAASSRTQYYLNIRAELPWNGITYMGASSKSVFDSRGLKYSIIDGLKVTVQASVTNVVIWNLDVGVFGSVNYTSSGLVDFNNCYFTTNAGGAGITGWRMSHSSNSADISMVTWRNCNVQGDMGTASGARTSVGWRWGGSNTLNMTWYSSSASFCSKGWTSIPDSGGAGTHGGDCNYWYGCGGSYCDIDFELKTTGNWVICGGRWEEGRQFLSVPQTNYAGLATISMMGVKLETYNPPGGRLFEIGSAIALRLLACSLRLLSVAADTDMIYASTASGAFGSITLDGCALPSDAPSGSTSASPYTGGITTGTGTWVVHVQASMRTNSANESISIIDY